MFRSVFNLKFRVKAHFWPKTFQFQNQIKNSHCSPQSSLVTPGHSFFLHSWETLASTGSFPTKYFLINSLVPLIIPLALSGIDYGDFGIVVMDEETFLKFITIRLDTAWRHCRYTAWYMVWVSYSLVANLLAAFQESERLVTGWWTLLLSLVSGAPSSARTTNLFIPIASCNS